MLSVYPQLVTCSDNSDLRIWYASLSFGGFEVSFLKYSFVGALPITSSLLESVWVLPPCMKEKVPTFGLYFENIRHHVSFNLDYLRCISQSAALKRSSQDLPSPTLDNYFATPSASTHTPGLCCLEVNHEAASLGQPLPAVQVIQPLSPVGEHSFVRQFTSDVAVIADGPDAMSGQDTTPKRKRNASSRLGEGTKRRRLHEGKSKENKRDISLGSKVMKQLQ